MSEIMDIGKNKQEQLYFTIFSGNTSISQQALVTLLFCYSNEINFEKIDENGMNVIHNVCKSGNYKLAQLIFSYEKDEKKLLKLIETPVHDSVKF